MCGRFGRKWFFSFGLVDRHGTWLKKTKFSNHVERDQKESILGNAAKQRKQFWSDFSCRNEILGAKQYKIRQLIHFNLLRSSLFFFCLLNEKTRPSRLGFCNMKLSAWFIFPCFSKYEKENKKRLLGVCLVYSIYLQSRSRVVLACQKPNPEDGKVKCGKGRQERQPRILYSKVNLDGVT